MTKLAERFLALMLLPVMAAGTLAQQPPTAPYKTFTTTEQTETVRQAIDRADRAKEQQVHDTSGLLGRIAHRIAHAIDGDARANEWLLHQIVKVRRDMGDIEPDKPINRWIGGEFQKSWTVNARENDVGEGPNHGGSLLCGVMVNDTVFDVLTVAELKIILAHEIEHALQPHDKPDAWRERDSDLAAAKTYGPKAVIDLFEKLALYMGQGDPLGSHGTFHARQQMLRVAFPKIGDYQPETPFAPAINKMRPGLPGFISRPVINLPGGKNGDDLTSR